MVFSLLRKAALFTAAVFLPLFAALPCYALPGRIVSLSPVGTEILFALGQGRNVIGVTKFCDYPPEALKKPRISGFAGVNLEALVAQKPGLVVIQDIHEQLASQLESLGIPYVRLNQDNISGIYRAINKIGGVCGADKKAAVLTAAMKKSVAEVSARTKGLKRPAVLVCVSRELADPAITTFYAAGRGTFYDELIRLAGGVNACPEGRAQYPRISAEGLSVINPDVIIDLVGDRAFYHSDTNADTDKIFSPGHIKNQWLAFQGIKASRAGRVYIMEGTVYLRPGPRIGSVLRSFASAIHPEAFRK